MVIIFVIPHGKQLFIVHAGGGKGFWVEILHIWAWGERRQTAIEKKWWGNLERSVLCEHYKENRDRQIFKGFEQESWMRGLKGTSERNNKSADFLLHFFVNWVFMWYGKILIPAPDRWTDARMVPVHCDGWEKNTAVPLQLLSCIFTNMLLLYLRWPLAITSMKA